MNFVCVHSHQWPRAVGERMSCPSHRLVAQAVAIVLREVVVWSVLFVFLVPVDSDVVLTASVVLRAKGLP